VALAAGLVASTSANPAGQDGLFYGHPEQFVYQLVGVACCIGWSGCWTAALVLLYVSGSSVWVCE